jgi:hypothetical protein
MKRHATLLAPLFVVSAAAVTSSAHAGLPSPAAPVTTPGASIVTPDATHVVIVTGAAGDQPAPPVGSKCLVGQSEWDLDLANASFTWKACKFTGTAPSDYVQGAVATGDDPDALRTLLAKVVVAPADQGFCFDNGGSQSIHVTGATGAFDYAAVCRGSSGKPAALVTGLDDALSALRALAGN